MKSIRTQLSLAILLLTLITVGFIGLLSNIFVNRGFTAFITEQGRLRSESIVSDLGRHYNSFTRTWYGDYLHIIGMYAMHEGYILKIFDLRGEYVWDAENHDCWHVMDDITARMVKRGAGGEYVTNTFDIEQNGQKVGSASVTYYGPYFLSEAEFSFINAINTVLFVIGILAAIFSIFVGVFLARKIAWPVSRTAQIAKQIAEGNYNIRFERNTRTRELNDLAAAINYLADALREQENLRKRLTADVAHELRTPLTAIGSHLEAMIMGLWEATPERLQGCHDEVKRLDGLVSDLGQLAKIEDGNLKLHKTIEDLLEIAQTVADNMRLEADKKKLALSVVGKSSFVDVDKGRINQVITNLLSNAVKFTLEGGNIEIEITDSDRFSIIKIKDSGIGISEQALPLIFERFYRIENSRNRKSGGAGIGLTIVNAIVQAHGGIVSVDSEQMQGTCFTVTLPKK